MPANYIATHAADYTLLRNSTTQAETNQYTKNTTQVQLKYKHKHTPLLEHLHGRPRSQRRQVRPRDIPAICAPAVGRKLCAVMQLCGEKRCKDVLKPVVVLRPGRGSRPQRQPQ